MSSPPPPAPRTPLHNIISVYSRTLRGPEELFDFVKTARTRTHFFVVRIECFHGDRLAERAVDGPVLFWPDPGTELKQLLHKPKIFLSQLKNHVQNTALSQL